MKANQNDKSVDVSQDCSALKDGSFKKCGTERVSLNIDSMSGYPNYNGSYGELMDMCHECMHDRNMEGMDCGDTSCPLFAYRTSVEPIALIENRVELILDACLATLNTVKNINNLMQLGL